MVSCQLSVIGCQLSVVSYQLSVISYQLSVVSCQLSVVSVSSRTRTDAFDPDSYRGQPPMLVISAQNKNCVKNVSAKKQLFSD